MRTPSHTVPSSACSAIVWTEPAHCRFTPTTTAIWPRVCLSVSGRVCYLFYSFRFVAASFSARGDLTRLLGMRTVAFLGLLSEINADVALSTKARVVGGICFSKAMFWDSKYHVSFFCVCFSLMYMLFFEVSTGGIPIGRCDGCYVAAALIPPFHASVWWKVPPSTSRDEK